MTRAQKHRLPNRNIRWKSAGLSPYVGGSVVGSGWQLFPEKRGEAEVAQSRQHRRRLSRAAVSAPRLAGSSLPARSVFFNPSFLVTSSFFNVGLVENLESFLFYIRSNRSWGLFLF